MLQIMMYHRVGDGKHTNSLVMMQAHLKYIARTFSVLLPGDPIQGIRRSICLSFDDASYDFYAYIYPLLRALKLRALLAVPTYFIVDKTSLSLVERLAVPYFEAMQGSTYREKIPFCTWEELHEMVASGHVELAAHGHKHLNMTKVLNVTQELLYSKAIIEDKTRQFVSSFVYPYGQVSREVHQKVMKHYTYAMRIGGATNLSWDSQRAPLCRIVGDHLQSPKEVFSLGKSCLILLKGGLKPNFLVSSFHVSD